MLPSAPVRRRQGFTLVELAIVLVILGLLVGGTLAGSTMIRNAELRSMAEEKEQYIAAITQFRTRYQYLPGDFARAGDYFGLSTYCGGTSSSSTATCNGDGNGTVDMDGLTVVGAPFNEELFFVWAHLFASGLVSIDYTGQKGLADNDIIGGQNAPNSKAEPGTWMFVSLGAPDSDTIYFNGTYNHTLVLASDSQTAPTDFNLSGVLTPQETYALDAKVDDGRPATGNIRTPTGAANPDCTIKADASGDAVDSDLDAVYRIGKNDPGGVSDSIGCALLFPQAVK